MPNSPQRPFVPKRTPAENRTSASEGQFRVAPPFVHGQARRSAPTAPLAEEPRPMASISEFLAAEEPARSDGFLGASEPSQAPDFLAPDEPRQSHEVIATSREAWTEAPSIGDFVAPESAFDYGSPGDTDEPADDSYDLPPIEHFIDPITDDAMPVAQQPDLASDDPFAELALPSVADEHGWEETGWQRYDWRSAAALGEAGDPAANSAWAQTDWDNPGSGRRARESAAQAIADALDGIARRIREGDLVMPQPPAAVPDPATIAATLAALLGVRR